MKVRVRYITEYQVPVEYFEDEDGKPLNPLASDYPAKVKAVLDGVQSPVSAWDSYWEVEGLVE